MNIKKILKEHKLWLDTDGVKGKRANLWGANLHGVDLREADLRGADLWGANLQGADLRKANFRGADLRGAYLQGAYLQRADLREADLQAADLREADFQAADLREADLIRVDLRDAYLQGANLQGAYLQRADLRGANLQGAYLRGADLTDCKLPNYSILPKGDLIVYKKVCNDIVLELLISKETKRVCSLVGRKCRAQAVKVLAAWDADNNETTDKERKFYSMNDHRFAYQIGSIVEVADFDDDIRVECTRGIHFFVTKEEASNYK